MLIYLLICLAAGFTSLKKHSGSSPSVDYLNRHQTEEWKGWMQVGRPFLVLTDAEYVNQGRIYSACVLCRGSARLGDPWVFGLPTFWWGLAGSLSC